MLLEFYADQAKPELGFLLKQSAHALDRLPVIEFHRLMRWLASLLAILIDL